MNPDLKNFWTDVRSGRMWGFFRFNYPERTAPLHAMPTTCGFETRSDPSYRFSGLSRGNSGFAIFQYTVAGEGALLYEGKKFILSPGDAFLVHIPHDHIYYFDPDGNSTFWTHLFMTVHGSELLRLMLQMEKEHGPVLHFDLDSPFIQRLAGRLQRIRSGQIPQTPFAASAFAYDFVMDLCDSVSSSGQHKTESELLRTIHRYCIEHLSEEIALEDLARSAGYSKFHFSRLFRNASGLTPAAFLQELRLETAHRMLQIHVDRTIKEIALECGFRGESYFCSCFRKKYGCSPLTFRSAAKPAL